MVIILKNLILLILLLFPDFAIEGVATSGEFNSG
jgi:hypothetical protein